MSATQAKYERLLQDLRADLRPQRAWGEGRGIFMVLGHFVVGIAAGAFLYLVPQFVPEAPWGNGSFLAASGYGLALLGMLILMGYMGFVYWASKAIPFWTSPLHPALYVAYALRGGGVALLLVQAFGAGSLAGFSELLLWWTGITAVVMVLFALEVHGALAGGNEAARRSVRELFAGRVAGYFYGGTLALGLALPAWLGVGGGSGARALPGG